MFILRAHHFLCMQGFQGYGYSSGFVEDMKRIVSEIRKNPDMKVKIIDSCDDICASCTNNVNGKCRNYNSIEVMDKKVLKKLDIKSGQELTVSELFDKVNKKIKNKETADDICGKCLWYSKCLWRLSIR